MKIIAVFWGSYYTEYAMQSLLNQGFKYDSPHVLLIQQMYPPNLKLCPSLVHPLKSF